MSQNWFLVSIYVFCVDAIILCFGFFWGLSGPLFVFVSKTCVFRCVFLCFDLCFGAPIIFLCVSFSENQGDRTGGN